MPYLTETGRVIVCIALPLAILTVALVGWLVWHDPNDESERYLLRDDERR